MEIILLERVEKLGGIGSVVRVKDGFARNFLIPRGKALRATASNVDYFEKIKAQVEAENIKNKGSAEERAQHLEGKSAVIVRQASEKGHLYGSVSAKDIAEAFSSICPLDKTQVVIESPIKTVGIHPLTLRLHPEISAQILVCIAQTQEEAEKMLENSLLQKDDQARKESV